MTQPTLPTDKTIRMEVKLVGTDGVEIPFKGVMLVPEDRLVLFEKVAAAARTLLTRNRTALETQQDPFGTVKEGFKTLDDAVTALEKLWVIPQG
jgi:hypothetical protein